MFSMTLDIESVDYSSEGKWSTTNISPSEQSNESANNLIRFLFQLSTMPKKHKVHKAHVIKDN